MSIRGIKRVTSIFAILCVLVMNFSAGFTGYAKGQSELLSIPQSLSVTEAAYSPLSGIPAVQPLTITQNVYPPTPTVTEPTVTQSVYSTPAYTPTPTVTEPTVTQSVYSTPVYTPTPIITEPTVTGSVYSTPAYTPTPTTTLMPTITPTPTTVTSSVYYENADYGNDINSAFIISDNTSVTGSVNRMDLVDVFSFTPSESSTISIHLIYENSVIVKVMDSNGNAVGGITDCNKNRTHIFFSVQKYTRYYIKIESLYKSDSMNYTFSIVDHYFDQGDDFETATEVFIGQAIGGSIENDEDVDCFKLIPGEKGIYCIYSRDDTFSINLFDEDGSKLIITDNYIHLDANKTYYLKVCNCYNEGVGSWAYDFQIKGPIIDDYANGSEYSEEIYLDKQVKGRLNYVVDDDYFCFKPSDDGIYFIEDFITTSSYGFTSNNSTESLLSVLGGKVSVKNRSKAYFKLSKDNTYYIRISNDRYKVVVDYSFTIRGPIKDDVGDATYSAKEIQLDTQIQCSAEYFDDVDVFSFKPTVSGIYYIDNFTTDDSNMSLDKNLSLSNSDCINSKVYMSCKEDVTYYMSFKSSSSNSTGYNYSFVLKGPLVDDYGDAREMAEEIQLNKQVKGILGYRDRDYFSFKPVVDGAYYIDDFSKYTDNYSQKVSGNLYVINSNGSIINTYYDNDQKTCFNLQKGSICYIYVDNTSKDMVYEYSFTLKEPIEDDYGNSQAMAAEIKLNDEVKGSIGFSFDNDCFCFKPSDTGIYYIDNLSKVLNNGANYNTSINDVVKAVNSMGNSVTIGYNDAYQKIFFSFFKDNKYYISIKNANNLSLFNYSFSLKGPIIDDYDNTPSQAKKIELGKSIKAKADYPDDCDSFSFSTNAKGYYCIEASIISKSEIFLYDETYKKVYESSTNYDRTKINYYLMANQTYYIILKKFYNNDPAHTICVNGPITDEADSIIVNMGENHAAINYDGDKDDFIFIPSSSGTYYFDLNHKNDLLMRIIGNNATSVQYQVNEKGTISCNLIANTSYRITISSSMNLKFVGQYTLKISDNPDTAIIKRFKISGYVKPDFTDEFSMREGFAVVLSGTDLFAISDEEGYFEISDVSESLTGYDIVITKENYLKREIKGIIVNDNFLLSKPEAPIELWVGDMGKSRDGAINLKDILQITSAFNSAKGDSRYLENLDINKDSAINMKDILIVTRHFNTSTQSYTKLSLV